MTGQPICAQWFILHYNDETLKVKKYIIDRAYMLLNVYFNPKSLDKDRILWFLFESSIWNCSGENLTKDIKTDFCEIYLMDISFDIIHKH